MATFSLLSIPPPARILLDSYTPRINWIKYWLLRLFGYTSLKSAMIWLAVSRSVRQPAPNASKGEAWWALGVVPSDNFWQSMFIPDSSFDCQSDRQSSSRTSSTTPSCYHAKGEIATNNREYYFYHPFVQTINNHVINTWSGSSNDVYKPCCGWWGHHQASRSHWHDCQPSKLA